MRKTVEARLFTRSTKMPSGCIEWNGSRLPKGYGQISVGGKNVLTHRVAWELANGPIPNGLFVLHRCDNPPCINKECLFLGTKAENNADRAAKGRSHTHNSDKTHCPQNHEYSKENTVIDNRGYRTCYACRVDKANSKKEVIK